MNDALPPDIVEEAESIMAELFTSMPMVTGALLASVDGRPLIALLEPDKRKGTAALVAAAFALGNRLADIGDGGQMQELTVRSERMYLSVYAVGDTAALVVQALTGVNLGFLHLKARAVAEQLRSVVDETLDRNPEHSP